MNKFIYKHRRGTTEQWATSDAIIYDGEIVVEKSDDGYTRLKVGDGTKKFSELPLINGASIIPKPDWNQTDDTKADYIKNKPTTLDGYGITDAAKATDVTNLSEEIAVERARINAIASLPEGSTTGDAELIDIRTAADGTTYETAGEAVRAQVNMLNEADDELKSDLNDRVKYSDVNDSIEFITKNSDNLLDKSTIVLYTRIKSDGSVTNPDPVNLSSYWTSQLIPIDSSKTYHTNTDTNIRICQYDENGNTLNGSGENYANTSMKTPFTPLTNCTDIRIQGYTGGQENWLVFCLESVEVQKQVDIPYGERKESKVIVDTILDKSSNRPIANSAVANSNIRKVIEIVHTDNIMDFYNAMVSAFEIGNCDVYIREGEYIYTNELIENIRAGVYNSYNRGIPIGHGCNYFFDTNAILICEYTGENVDDVSSLFSPLDSKNSAHSWGIYNLTLNAIGTLYGIHDESSGGTEPYTRKYENCYITLDSTGVGSDINKCIGGGAGANGEIIIRNCYFKTVNPLSTRCPDVTYHGASTSAKNNIKFVVDGCYFANGFECHSVGGDGIMKLLYCNNSSLLKITTNESGENKWIIRSWNNEYRTN